MALIRYFCSLNCINITFSPNYKSNQHKSKYKFHIQFPCCYFHDSCPSMLKVEQWMKATCVSFCLMYRFMFLFGTASTPWPGERCVLSKPCDSQVEDVLKKNDKFVLCSCHYLRFTQRALALPWPFGGSLEHIIMIHELLRNLRSDREQQQQQQ